MSNSFEQPKMEKTEELAGLLDALPPVEFCCAYGSAILPNNQDKNTMVDYILGVSDPMLWHSQNLQMNRKHYASWMVHLGGAKLITQVADEIGVGVHFNPFVTYDDKLIKYGVVRMHDLVQDILNWERFYLSGRLQKPVHILVDTLNVENLNSVNLKAATSAALLLLSSKFSEEDLYAKICSLSYMGDLRMLFAEDRNKVIYFSNEKIMGYEWATKFLFGAVFLQMPQFILQISQYLQLNRRTDTVKKIVQGQFSLFQRLYKPFLEEYAAKDLLIFSSTGDHQAGLTQDCSVSAARALVSSLPPTVRSEMGIRLGEKQKLSETGRTIREVVINSREEAAECMRKVVRRTVMVSSMRQATSGLLAVGGVNAIRYISQKMGKAWRSWT